MNERGGSLRRLRSPLRGSDAAGGRLLLLLPLLDRKRTATVGSMDLPPLSLDEPTGPLFLLSRRLT